MGRRRDEAGGITERKVSCFNQRFKDAKKNITLIKFYALKNNRRKKFRVESTDYATKISVARQLLSDVIVN